MLLEQKRKAKALSEGTDEAWGRSVKITTKFSGALCVPRALIPRLLAEPTRGCRSRRRQRVSTLCSSVGNCAGILGL